MQGLGQQHCHYYHTIGCNIRNCQNLHIGPPKGRCPGKCRFCDTPCKFGVACKNSNCFYNHSNDVKPTPHYQNQGGGNPNKMRIKCKFGNRCTNSECRFLHDDYHDEQQAYNAQKAYNNTQDIQGDTEETKCDFDDGIQEQKNRMKNADKNGKNGNPVPSKEPKNKKEAEIRKEETKMNSLDDPRKVEEAERQAFLRVLNLKGNYRTVDLVFVIDCTKSMRKFIEMVRQQTINIIEKTKSFITEDIAFRVGVVGYRDYDDEAARLEVFPFGTASEATKFVEKLKVAQKAGADGPEDVNGGIQEALKLKWHGTEKKVIRYLVHIGDAPCHGTEYHNSSKDRFPEGHEKDRDFKEMFAEMNKREINYLFLRIKDRTDQMIEKFREYYEDPSIPQSGTVFSTEEINENDGELFTSIVATSIQMTFIASTTATVYNVNDGNEDSNQPLMVSKYNQNIIQAIKNKRIENNPALGLSRINKAKTGPDVWKTSSFNSLFFFSNNLEAILNDPNYHWNNVENKVTVNVQAVPFANGSFSYAYNCKVSIPKNQKEFNEFDMVLKKPIERQKDTYYIQGLKKNLMAIIIANKFNELLDEKGFSTKEKIYFSRIMYLTNGQESCFIEGYIKGEFTKYTNNSMFVNEAYPLMTAFTHFSYVVTGGKYMVTDLQGAGNLLTDPTIHSRNKEFREHADKSLDGMMAFFINHKCSDYCRKLELPGHFAQKEAKSVLKIGTGELKCKPKCSNPYCNEAPNGSDLCKKCKTKEVNLNKLLGF